MQWNSKTTTVIESLEPRRLLSAVGDVRSAVLDDSGQLVITGSNKRDAIRISLDANDGSKLNVKISKRETLQFDLSEITNGVHISTGNGNDRVTVREKNGAIKLDMTILGGNGNDAIFAGSGDDRLEGNNGKDLLKGGAGNDVLIGDNGKDRLLGQDGNDLLSGGNGKDRLDGGEDDDTLTGGTGKDALIGRAGNDVFSTEDRRKERKDFRVADTEDETLDGL